MGLPERGALRPKIAPVCFALFVVATAPCPSLADDGDCQVSATGSGYQPTGAFCPAEDLRSELYVPKGAEGQEAFRRGLAVAHEKLLSDPLLPADAASKLARRIDRSMS